MSDMSAKIPLYQVDAFTDTLFKGNPAAVCPLAEWLPDGVMQAIAAENNLAETAFFVGGQGRFKLRWFTPAAEIDLCGHATLASAFVVFAFMDPQRQVLSFDSRSGPLSVTRQADDYLALDFPSRAPGERVTLPALAEALGAPPQELWAGERDYMAVYGSEEEVRALAPDMQRLERLDRLAVMVTAPGREADFVSRFFAPKVGVPEDPVTGSSHCTLIPYWAERLKRDTLLAQQVSPRGGELLCTARGARVGIAGRCVLYLRGTIEV
jgi:PhzF family phenazine biosynthesis protein